MTRKPIPGKHTGLRQRQRKDGSWRIWYEPSEAQRDAGMKPFELDADRPTWSVNKAKDLAKEGKDTAQKVASNGQSIAALIKRYKKSRFYTEKKPATQRDYHTKMLAIQEKWGSVSVVRFSKPVINEWYETMLRSGHLDWANGRVGMMSILMSYAETIGWRPEQSNPCFRMKLKPGTKRKRRGAWAEYDALIAAAEARAAEGRPAYLAMAAAIALALFTGQRREDILSAKLDDFADRELELQSGETVRHYSWALTRSKRGNFDMVPVHQEAAPRIRTLIDAAQPGQTLLMHDPAINRPITGDRFGKMFRDIRERAVETEPTVHSLQFRDLRRTFGNLSRAGGASKSDVADVLGNTADTDAGLAEIYMARSIDTMLRAQNAVQRPRKAG